MKRPYASSGIAYCQEAEYRAASLLAPIIAGITLRRVWVAGASFKWEVRRKPSAFGCPPPVWIISKCKAWELRVSLPVKH